MQKRLLLAFVLSIVILVVFQYLSPPVRKVPSEKVTIESVEEEKEKPVAPVTTTKVPVLTTAEREKLLAGQKTVPPKEIKVETPLYKAIISNHGGRIVQWQLTNYYSKENGEATPLELISPESQQSGHYPLELLFADEGLTARVNSSYYEVSTDELLLDVDTPEGKISISYLDPSGIKVTKWLTFHQDNYDINIRIAVENLADTAQNASYYLSWKYNFGSGMPQEGTHHQANLFSWLDEKLVKDKPDKIKGKISRQGNLS